MHDAPSVPDTVYGLPGRWGVLFKCVDLVADLEIDDIGEGVLVCGGLCDGGEAVAGGRVCVPARWGEGVDCVPVDDEGEGLPHRGEEERGAD